VLRTANELVAAKLMEDWALGGALAAIYYVEPFTTYDADIFFIPADKGSTWVKGVGTHKSAALSSLAVGTSERLRAFSKAARNCAPNRAHRAGHPPNPLPQRR